ncbi:protease inhibitor I42 family protein [Streptomyces caelestis]|uniref:protease inhibitor I42 family protein n=1 Tax=Streptomyces caelestis TaxID=36816 RepID=UPI003655CFE7
MRSAERHASTAAVVTGLLLATGCGAGAADIAHHSSTDTRITAKVGQRFTIDVEENSSTGEHWYLVPPEPGDSVVRESGQRLRGADPDLTGSGGRRIFAFEAVGAGTTLVVLLHCPVAGSCVGGDASSAPRPSATAGGPTAQRITYVIAVE